MLVLNRNASTKRMLKLKWARGCIEKPTNLQMSRHHLSSLTAVAAITNMYATNNNPLKNALAAGLVDNTATWISRSIVMQFSLPNHAWADKCMLKWLGSAYPRDLPARASSYANDNYSKTLDQHMQLNTQHESLFMNSPKCPRMIATAPSLPYRIRGTVSRNELERAVIGQTSLHF
jgi:hypothetical protein